MAVRDTNLQQLLNISQRIIAASANYRAVMAGERIFESLARPAGSRAAATVQRLPACDHPLAAALAGTSAQHSPLPELGTAFGALEGGLHWYRRKNAEALGQPFIDGHANAVLIGPDGIEQRDDVLVGATVMAPHIVYPDHDHPPEEVYIAMSPGEWWNAEMNWTEPGPGGIIYNPPGILHAMRSHTKPFLALWFLPID
ncbi:MAG: dimethylsulfonioproprionate lyase family protein [Aestuariivirga sp.]|uniref:dimethylsulfonioproprionate lyase family protein n=1 Tax=Aestuariivirga sp. TaxID=2650926 RepID=UPI003016EFC5